MAQEIVNIYKTGLGGTWEKLVDKADFPRRGWLTALAGSPIECEVAYSNSPAAGETVLITNDGMDYVLPAYKELWARREGVAGTTALHGVLRKCELPQP